jgi:hypothetical protein
MLHGDATPDASPPARPPGGETLEDLALDAMILAVALVAQAQGGPRAADRMELLAWCGRSGLLHTPPQRDVLQALDASLLRLSASRKPPRAVMVRTMNALVGSEWAPIVAHVAERVATGTLPAAAMVRAIRLALALPP